MFETGIMQKFSLSFNRAYRTIELTLFPQTLLIDAAAFTAQAAKEAGVQSLVDMSRSRRATKPRVTQRATTG